ncbi:GIY-YIG nuclease family protein, partial [Eubacterium aggregans]|uniref:GIY-YIG nuclease family protein n=1 Tax=Eubacterium aggregans TaxID=81409 RepID=UPI003F302080
IIGIIFLSKKGIKEKEIKQLNLSQYISALSHLNNIQRDIVIKEKTYSEFIEKTKTDAESEYQSILAQKQDELEEINTKINNRETIFEEYSQEAKEKTDKELQDLLGNQYHIREELIQKTKELEKINKSLKTQTNKLDKVKELYRAANYAISKYTNIDILSNEIKLPALKEEELNSLSPTVTLNLHSMDVPGLKKAFRKNDKLIEQTLKQYADRYTTKANVAIYKLMVMALRSELQNVLTNLKYDLIDKSTENIKLITAKYSKIAADGNQSIAPTLIRFIGEIEYLFLNAVKIEYEYYTKREAQKAEQAAIREQMKQEAAERKELERQKVQVEAEELKFTSKMDELIIQMQSTTNQDMVIALNEKINELKRQLEAVAQKKEEIISRQNGKAGNVYIISNLGSFGKNVFKIGMTRRLEPQDRIRELSGASVPFQFDVHSLILSDDAVALESKLHTILNEKRVNKINMRKEFFSITIDEIEELVHRLDPTAEFITTMLAEEYRQTQSLIGDAV